MSNLLNQAIAWIGDIYQQHGWQAGVITLVVIVALVAGLAWGFDLPLGQLLGLP